MAGVDAGYLYMETPTQHMHTLKVAVLKPSRTTPMDAPSFEAAMSERLDRLPPLRKRVLPVPFQLNHPLWIEDRPIDPALHIIHHTLPAPGSMRQLEELIGEIAGTRLDRSRPLWEMHVVDGLGDGRFAVATKMHHALADGSAANALLANITDTLGAEPVPRPPLEPTPGRLAQVRSALWDAIVQTLHLPALLLRTGRAVAAVVQHKKQSGVAVPRPVLDVPRTSFNAALTPRRSFATVALSLDAFKAVRRHHLEASGVKVTLNDVVLAVVGGALRRWLDESGEVVRTSLTAGVPVGTDAPDSPARLGGNRVSNLFTTLATDIDDPAQRLLEISRVTSEAKAVQHVLGLDMMADWVQFTPPGPFALVMRGYSRSRAASLHAAPFNVVVSNVPGLREETSIAGATLSDFFSVGPILEGIGLNVTVWSYVDRMNFSLLSCPDLIPDLQPLVAQFAPALAELAPRS